MPSSFGWFAALAVALAACGGLPPSSSMPAAPGTTTAAASPTEAADCDSSEVPLAFVLSMQPAERVACFGSGEIRFKAYYPQGFGAGGCAGDEVAGDGWLRPCVLEGIVVYAQPGRPNGLLVHLHPDLEMELSAVPVESWLIVQGHFDDPAAKDCRKLANGEAVVDPAFVEACRQEFVATDLQPAE